MSFDFYGAGSRDHISDNFAFYGNASFKKNFANKLNSQNMKISNDTLASYKFSQALEKSRGYKIRENPIF